MHTHLAVHTDAKLLPNGSFTGGTVSHIGQLFYEEGLTANVSALSPYVSNTVERMTNDDDTIAQQQADNNYDPFVQYVLLNADNLADGLFAWIEIGIDPSANHTSSASVAAIWAADGGHSTGTVFSDPDGIPNGSGGNASVTASGSSSTGAPIATVTSSGAVGRRNAFAWLRLFG